MKKVVIAIVSFFYCLFGFCQSKVLYLKSKDIVRFQTWDTIYASVRKDSVVLSDSKGKSYRLKLCVDKNGSDAVIMLSEKHYHLHGTPCRNGSVLMDKKMKLFFDEKSMPFTYYSSFVDHGSHASHMSHFSSSNFEKI